MLTIFWKPGWRAQEGSNLKMDDLGTVEEIWICRGTWSEVVRVRDERMELGRIESQARPCCFL
jgi:hypothetical protein